LEPPNPQNSSNSRPLDYERITPLAEPVRFTWGLLSATLSLLAAGMTMAVFLASYRARMFPLGINGTLRLTLLLSIAALCIGIFALFKASGRSSAVLGIVIAILNLGFIPSFMV
jgi:hypothetical protein